MIRVLVVDDHKIVRTGLVGLLEAEADLEVIGEAADGQAAVAAVLADPPDVVLMDLSMPVLDGVGATRRISAAARGVRVVVLTSFADHTRVGQALEAGAVGYQLKDSDPAELVAAVRAAAAGHVPIDPKVAAALLPQRRSGPTLSPREQDVLRLVALGMANKQIGRRLGIAERTVKAHLGRVFREIGVSDRTSAALWAREHLPD